MHNLLYEFCLHNLIYLFVHNYKKLIHNTYIIHNTEKYDRVNILINYNVINGTG